MNERRRNLFAGSVLSALGLAIAGPTMGTWQVMVGTTITACGLNDSKGPFLAMPEMFLTAPATAIAQTNSIGNLDGFF
jgi:hypothetical protein